MNLTTLKANAIAELGLSSTSDDTQMTTHANNGVLDILLRTGCYVATATATETSGTGDYTLDTGVIRIKGLQWSSTGLYSQPARTTVDDIIRLRSTNAAATAFPASYYALAGSNMLMVYPTPSSADTITLYYTPRPTAMSTGLDDPSTTTLGGIPSEFHDAIQQYMLWHLASEDDNQKSSSGELYRVRYEGRDGNSGWIGMIRKYMLKKGGPAPKAVINGRRMRVPHRNDLY